MQAINTSSKDGSTIDFYETKKKIKRLLQQCPDRKCSVHLLHGYMSKEELSSLYTHPQIKAIVNFGHGEGYGLPLFEAAAVGLPVITHDWGGQKDFLYAPKKDKSGKEKIRPHFSKISFDLKPIQKEAVWDSVLQPESQWAFPHWRSCQIAMRQCFENYGLCAGVAMLRNRRNCVINWLCKDLKASNLSSSSWRKSRSMINLSIQY